jgi:hypothetical protein
MNWKALGLSFLILLFFVILEQGLQIETGTTFLFFQSAIIGLSCHMLIPDRR